MLLPIRIVYPYQRTGYVTYALLALNVLVFLLTRSDLDGWVADLGLQAGNFAFHQLITSAFMHADFWHLLGNSIYLIIFGRYVEERLGHARFAAVYLSFALVGSAAILLFEDRIAIGASGAISGLLGFVVVAAPWLTIRALLLWVLPGGFRPFDIAALWLIGLWVVMDVVGMLNADPSSSVAYSAHLGGALGGAALAVWLGSSRMKGTNWWLDPAKAEQSELLETRLGRARSVRRAGPGITTAYSHSSAKAVVVMESMMEAKSPVAIVKLLMRHAGMAPEMAKKHVDALQAGEVQRIGLGAMENVPRFIEAGRELGLVARPDAPARVGG